MAIVAPKRATNLRSLIIRKLNEREYRPVDLLHQLLSQDVSESAAKDELAALIDAQVIELSPDRHIRLRSRHEATLRAIR
jgi:hypothetical protein